MVVNAGSGGVLAGVGEKNRRDGIARLRERSEVQRSAETPNKVASAEGT